MKGRIIRGISRVPVRRGILFKKKVGEHRPGFVPVVCPGCTNANFWLPTLVAQTCGWCRNTAIELSIQDYQTATSMKRVERYAVAVTMKVPDSTVITWCHKHIVQNRMRSYLGLNSRSAAPRLNHQKVSSRVYINVLRFTMFNIVCCDQRQLRFLERNQQDVTGCQMFEHSPMYRRMFGDVNYADPRGLDTDVDYLSDVFTNPQRPPDIDAMRTIMEIYSLGGTAFREDPED